MTCPAAMSVRSMSGVREPRERSSRQTVWSHRSQMKRFQAFVIVTASVFFARTSSGAPASPGVAGNSGSANLVIANDGKSDAIVAVASDAGEWETKGAVDLVEFIEKLSGARPALANNRDTIA